MIYYILLMISIVFLDQLTKWLAVICLKGEESFPLWEGVFHFTYVENTGSAFGMLKDHRWVFMIISTVVIIAFAAIFVAYYKKLTPLMKWAISFLIAGGIGNMIDRIALGYVVDFFDFTLIDFAVFNVADSFVCIGAGLFVLWFILDSIHEMKAKKTEKVFAASDDNGVSVAAVAENAESETEDQTENTKTETNKEADISECADTQNTETRQSEETAADQETKDANPSSDTADTENAETWNSGDAPVASEKNE